LRIKKADFVKSAVKEADYPEFNGIEFSFIGRSNVGKSSLINSLTGRRSLARTSKTPGRTQLINYFLIDSKRKKIVFLLLDLRRIPSGEDMEMLKWLEHYEVEYYIIFTKSDKLSNNEKFRQLKEIKKKLQFDNEDVFFYSSLKNTGREELTDFIYKRKEEYDKTGE